MDHFYIVYRLHVLSLTPIYDRLRRELCLSVSVSGFFASRCITTYEIIEADSDVLCTYLHRFSLLKPYV